MNWLIDLFIYLFNSTQNPEVTGKQQSVVDELKEFKKTESKIGRLDETDIENLPIHRQN